MIPKTVSIILLIAALFAIFLVFAYYGFQLSAEFYTQEIFNEPTNSVCEKMNNILSHNDLSRYDVIRAISDQTDLRNLGLNSNSIKIIENCLIGELPTLSSNLTYSKIGFFEGLDGHSAKGKAVVALLENTSYLRLENFEIGYDDPNPESYQVPELHVYLSTGSVYSPDVYLDKLKTKLGNKNYVLPDVDLNVYNVVVIYDEINDTPYAKIKLNNPLFVSDVFFDFIDKNKTVPIPKIESRIVQEKHGFFKSVGNFEAKGSVVVDYLEDEATLQITNFEISTGEDLRLYMTKDGDMQKSGYWVSGPNGNLYVSSSNTDEVLRYSSDGTFEDVFVGPNSGGLDGPTGMAFDPSGRLYVSSSNTDEVLRYSSDGTFEDVFVGPNSGGLDGPKDIDFGPDDNLYVSSDNRILRFDGSTGLFINDFVMRGSGGLNLSSGFAFDPSGRLYVSSSNTDEVLRYSSDGTFEDVFVGPNSGGLDGPKDVQFSTDGKYLYVSSFLTGEILRYDAHDGKFIDNFVSSHDGKIMDPAFAVFGPDDNLYVSSDNRILRFDGSTGLFINDFVMRGSGGLNLSSGFAFDPSGRLYVSSSNTDEVLRYSSDGTFEDVFVGPNSGGLDGPTGMAFDPSGRLYVSSSNTDEVLRYSSDGTFEDVFVDSSLIKNPQGLVFGPDGNLYVVSSSSAEILLFDGDGEFVKVFASGGGLHIPFDLTFDPSGRLYVSSSNTDEVLRYSSDGTFEDVFVDSSLIKNPQGLVFDPDGNLYVVNHSINEVIKIEMTNDPVGFEPFVFDRSYNLDQPKILGFNKDNLCVGKFFSGDIQCYDGETGASQGFLVKSFNHGMVGKENSLIGPDGELYVSNNLTGEILRYDSLTGILFDAVVKPDNNRLHGPSDLVFGPDGNLYVSSDDKILKFDGNNGNFLELFVSQNESGLDNPQDLLFDEEFLYLSSYDNNRVLRYNSSSGDFESEFIPSRNNGLHGPVGMVIDKFHNAFYVSNTLKNKILQYDLSTGKFLNEFKLDFSPHRLVLGDDGLLFVSSFASDKVGMYDVQKKQFVSLFSDVDGLSGPDGLAYDSVNHMLYVVSSNNSKLFAYDLNKKNSDLVIPVMGDGVLQNPRGIILHDDSLYIANSENNEILKYTPTTKTLSVFVHDIGDQMRPGGITFGPDSHLYAINEIDNQVYRYDVETGSLIGVFTDLESDNVEFDVSLRNIVFDKNDRYLFASNPDNNMLIAYNSTTGIPNYTFFKNSDELNYPTGLSVTPDGEYLFVINSGDNTILRFNSDDGTFVDTFIRPTKHGLDSIKKILFGQDGQVYLVGDTPDMLFKYDRTSGSFLGLFDVGSRHLGILNENPLSSEYLLNDIDIKTNDVLIVYDHFLEIPYAKTSLSDDVPIFTPISNSILSFVSLFDPVSDPKFQLKEPVRNTGFFVGLNNHDVFGQIKSKSVDDYSQITIENFFIQYDKEKYISTDLGNVLTNGPDLVSCMVPSSSILTCDSQNGSVELGDVKINAGSTDFIVRNIDLTTYDQLVIYDKISETPFAHVPLRDYGVLRVSGESFLDWLQYYLPIFPLIPIVVMIFPVVFDYVRTVIKVLFFIFHFFQRKPHDSSIGLHYEPTITILIPAHNEEYGIRRSIESAIGIDYPNKEIIVIDDGSSDRTFDIANSFAEKGLIKLVHLDPASGTKATALNYGKNYATGDYILCMDGDTLLDKNSLKHAVRHLSDKDVVALSGNVKILSGDDGVENTLTRLQKYEYMIAIELGRRFTSFFHILLVVSGAFGIFKKSSFTDVYTFDKDTLTEDFDLTLKLRKTKGKIKFVGDSIAYTYCPNNWAAWIGQRNRWAHGEFRTLSKNKNILTSKFPFKDKISFFDMFLLDVVLALLFPIGLAVLGVISVIMIYLDNLHVLVYSLSFLMLLFLLTELIVFLFSVLYSGQKKYLKLIYLVPVMTFFYRPFLKMVNLRGFLRAFFGTESKWNK